MAAKTITLGRDTSNTKVYNKGDISSKHAKITLIGNNEYEVEDLDSTNGTYVNGYRIKKAKISGNDQLRLSMDTIVDVPALFGAKLPFPPMPQKNSPKDFTNEFAQLGDIR
ncbi:FHA domain-containing protein [Capnocytophaga leadbetteri]|uniref:FHA domain-containing protein n=1 Tax=Capnocytophaga leadbetteri TaxID=327575 RepID=UPI0028D15BAB|nr:FHA domain-containing protein [Capnocytophaga leadbetteri]